MPKCFQSYGGSKFLGSYMDGILHYLASKNFSYRFDVSVPESSTVWCRLLEQELFTECMLVVHK